MPGINHDSLKNKGKFYKKTSKVSEEEKRRRLEAFGYSRGFENRNICGYRHQHNNSFTIFSDKDGSVEKIDPFGAGNTNRTYDLSSAQKNGLKYTQSAQISTFKNQNSKKINFIFRP